MDFENLPIDEQHNANAYRKILEDKKEDIITILNDIEIIKYGISVFSGEEDKFYRRLANPTNFFGGEPPIIQSKDNIINELTRIENRIFV